MQPDGTFEIDFPTLWVVPQWISRHCPIPSGFRREQPFVMYDWQLWCTVNHYRIRPDAAPMSLAEAFHYRRSQIVAPQKIGKGPWAATLVAVEGVGPVVFDGFAGKDDGYACASWGCRCGWEYPYRPGEPMARPWNGPLIQLLASSIDQTNNIYRPLQAMARLGPLGDLMRISEEFARLPNDGMIERVTSSALARLGNPIMFALQDETGLYTRANGLLGVAQTMRRGLAGMGGRAIGTTNAWDPAENSDAQQTAESRRPDIFRFHRAPPVNLSYRNKQERAKIHRYVYAGTGHITLASIEADAAELLETDPTQAERFFGNRVVYGKGTWQPDGLWESTEADRPVKDGIAVALGFDGSESDDWTAIRLEDLITGYRFTPTYGPDDRPTYWNPAEWGGSIPRGEVSAAVDAICTRYRVVRAYCDPRDWQSEIGDWALQHGDEVFLEWATYRIQQMFDALTRSVNDLRSGRSTHDGCMATATHVANARKVAKPGDKYILGKPNEHQKIDLAMADTLAHEAAADARAAGWKPKQPSAVPRRIR